MLDAFNKSGTTGELFLKLANINAVFVAFDRDHFLSVKQHFQLLFPFFSVMMLQFLIWDTVFVLFDFFGFC